MQTGTSRTSLALCAAVAASVCALVPATTRACTADFGATGPVGANSIHSCASGGAVAPAGVIDSLAADAADAADAAGPRVAAISAAATTTVQTTSFPTTAFVAPDVTINVGDTVQWVVNDSIHTVTRASGPEAFDSGLLFPGSTFSHTFTQVGVFDYLCQLHFGMVGTVTVLAAPVPEPATPILLAAGAAAAALRRRRRTV